MCKIIIKSTDEKFSLSANIINSDYQVPGGKYYNVQFLININNVNLILEDQQYLVEQIYPYIINEINEPDDFPLVIQELDKENLTQIFSTAFKLGIFDNYFYNKEHI